MMRLTGAVRRECLNLRGCTEPVDGTSALPEPPPAKGRKQRREVQVAEGTRPPELRDALRDLDDVIAEAGEEQFPAPSGAALANARRLLTAMYRISPRRYEVYPTPDGEIAIDAPGGYGRSVLLLCNSEGGALCLVNMNGAHRRARYLSAESLPNEFVRVNLAELS